MTEKEIFEHLFRIASLSNDTDGVVTACLVRKGEIIVDGVSAGAEHAEYILLQKIKDQSIVITPDDVLYVTLQPCDRRSHAEGEKLGDCTTNVIKSDIKQVVYAATYPKSESSLEKFEANHIKIRQCGDKEIVEKAVELFNSTNKQMDKHIPMPNQLS